MSAQLTLAVLPVADEAWARRRRAEVRLDRLHEDLIVFAKRVRALAERRGVLGWVSTREIVAFEELDGLDCDYDEAPAAWARVAQRLQAARRAGLLARAREGGPLYNFTYWSADPVDIGEPAPILRPEPELLPRRLDGSTPPKSP